MTMSEHGRPRVEDRMVRTIEVAHLHETLAVAAGRGAEAGLGALPVVDGDELLGMISAHDITRHQYDDHMDLGAVEIGDVVGPGVLHCFAQEDAAEAAAAMAALGVEYLPVLDAEKKLIGIVARDDLPPPEGAVKAGASEASGRGAADEPHPGLKVCSAKPQLKD
jgi:CBS domain-containing protein